MQTTNVVLYCCFELGYDHETLAGLEFSDVDLKLRSAARAVLGSLRQLHPSWSHLRGGNLNWKMG